MYYLFLFCHFVFVQSEYVLLDDYKPSSFADKFNFFTAEDPTHGYVNYVDREQAEKSELFKVDNNRVYIGVDHENKSTGRGRNSVRIESKANYTHGLFILDLQHMPAAICASWPAFWLVGSSWPNNGEIDIIEGVNIQKLNAMTLHTADKCSINKSNDFTGTLETQNCYIKGQGQLENQGCSIKANREDAYGDGFNAANGGIYATEWSNESIRIWHFPRSNIPKDISNGKPDPTSWTQPLAKFAGSCDIDGHFQANVIVFDITFCGEWAGRVWKDDCGSKSAVCEDFVRNQPNEFKDIYWLVNSLKVYNSHNNGHKIFGNAVIYFAFIVFLLRL